MSFKRAVTRLSDLVADTVVGAILQTASSGYYVKIWETVSGGVNNGLIQFFMGNPQANQPGQIVTSAIVDPTGATFDAVELDVVSPTTTRFTNPAALQLVPNLAGVVGLVRVVGELLINPGHSGTPIQGIDFGSENALLTDANGQVTIFHGLNAFPRVVQLTPRLRNKQLNVNTQDATTVIVRCTDNANVLLPAGTAVALDWLVMF